MKDQIVITGIGLCTPLGNSPEGYWKNLLSKKSAAKDWEDLRTLGFRNTVASRIEDFETTPLNRGGKLVDYSVCQAMQMAEIELEHRNNTGVFVGSTMGESGAFETAARGENLVLEDYSCQSFAERIKHQYNLTGPALSFGTACSAGNYAIHMAAEYLRSGQIEVAVAGGVDPFSMIAMAGFSRSRAMTTTGQCRPFDDQRDGMLLGEGSCFFILEKAENALQRGANPLAIVGAGGLSCDAYHPTAPHPDGEHMKRAMQIAISRQQIEAQDVDWICAHGSGTRLSDQIESRAIAETFGEEVTVCGIKGALGHTLGAATAIEAATCVMSLSKQMVPPTTNFSSSASSELNITNQQTSMDVKWVLNCGYAFGGLNSALLFGKWES